MTSRPYAADDFDAIHEQLKKLKMASLFNGVYDWWVVDKNRTLNGYYNLYPLSAKAKEYIQRWVPKTGYWSSIKATGYEGPWHDGLTNADWTFSPIYDVPPAKE